MHIQNIAGYKFTTLSELTMLREALLTQCKELNLRGTILLSSEGININLAGEPNGIEGFKCYLKKDDRFSDITFRESYSNFQPYQRMKVKIKKEIITMRQEEVRPDTCARPPSLTPEEFKQWLDTGRDVTVLDTRNDYEVQFGTFRNAIHLAIDDFADFPAAAKKISRDKPVVMFCTGGIRCEKAAIHLLNAGHAEVYQLHGGILNYFAKVGGDHYDGECFVFDERISVDANLQMTGTRQCTQCGGPIKLDVCTNCNSSSK